MLVPKGLIGAKIQSFEQIENHGFIEMFAVNDFGDVFTVTFIERCGDVEMDVEVNMKNGGEDNATLSA